MNCYWSSFLFFFSVEGKEAVPSLSINRKRIEFCKQYNTYSDLCSGEFIKPNSVRFFVLFFVANNQACISCRLRVFVCKIKLRKIKSCCMKENICIGCSVEVHIQKHYTVQAQTQALLVQHTFYTVYAQSGSIV